MQNLPYGNQLKEKKHQLEKLFKPLWQSSIKITPSPQTKYYRNKMEFSFIRQVDKTKTKPHTPLFFEQKLGQKQKNRWDRAFDLTQCYLLSPESVKLINAVRIWAQKYEIPYYDPRKHTGILRHLVVRESKNTADKMIILVSANDKFDKKSFLKAACNSYPATTVLSAINEKFSDTATCENFEILKGEGFITEKIFMQGNALSAKTGTSCEIIFKISPGGFFQTNTKSAEKIYEKVKDIVSGIKPRLLLDLYAGSGAFAMVCFDVAEKIICVEEDKSNICNGINNASLNGIGNIEFICAKTENFLAERKPQNADVIVDPPRCGLHPRAISNLLKIMPKNIIYVSCNPKTMFKDLQQLKGNYKIASIEAFDFFPHTCHIEVLSHLSSDNC